MASNWEIKTEILADPAANEGVQRRRVPELDGLRGFAILFVWVGHYFDLPGAGVFKFLDYKWFRMSWSGVDLFFVLSGFLIGGILGDVRESDSYFRTFYLRRFFRIIPVYYVWIFAYILLVSVAGPILRSHAHTGAVEPLDLPILAQFLFLQNFGEFLRSPASFWWFGVTWSLAVEEQFYLLSPLLVRFLSRRALTWFLWGVVAGAPVFRMLVHFYLQNGPSLAYRLMPARADALAIGMLASLFWRETGFRNWLATHLGMVYSLFGFLLAGFLAMWIWLANPQDLSTQTLGYSWLAFFYATMLFLALSHPTGPIASLARTTFLRELGRVSYCVYIIHPAVYLFCHQVVGHRLPSVTNASNVAVSVLAAIITYTIARISWKFFEEPLLRIGHQFKYGPTRVA